MTYRLYEHATATCYRRYVLPLRATAAACYRYCLYSIGYFFFFGSSYPSSTIRLDLRSGHKVLYRDQRRQRHRRSSLPSDDIMTPPPKTNEAGATPSPPGAKPSDAGGACLLYTSDAADE